MLTQWIRRPVEAPVHAVGRRSCLRTILLVLAIAAITGLAGCALGGSRHASSKPAVSCEIAVAIARALFVEIRYDVNIDNYIMEVDDIEGGWMIQFTPKKPAGPGSDWAVMISQREGELSIMWGQ
ncbi:MAG: hypothetical protein IT441_03995 [Phycisphaeraceae bacterium]|nr:hypothetical protein [Phycisphaeraceae bacterium]